MPVLTSVFAGCNVIVSPSKSRVVTSLPSNVEVYANLNRLRIVLLQHGFELMGGYYPGSLLDAFLQSKCALLKNLCDLIARLPEAHIAYSLLRCCTYAARVNHILRLVPSMWLGSWCANLTSTLRALSLPSLELRWLQCRLAVNTGGLGLSDLTHITEGAFMLPPSIL